MLHHVIPTEDLLHIRSGKLDHILTGTEMFDAISRGQEDPNGRIRMNNVGKG